MPERDWNRSSKWWTSKQTGRTNEKGVHRNQKAGFYIVTKKGSIFSGSSGDDMYLTRKKLILVD